MQTAGFPDLSVREFLHLLSHDVALKDVPFLWLSDCDAHGLLKWHILCFGSASTGWASSTTVCPRLQYAGMSHSMFDKVVDEFPNRQLAHDKTNDPSMTLAKQKELLDQYKAEANRRRDIAKNTVLSASKMKSNKKRLTGIQSAGAIQNHGDQLALDVFNDMKSGKAVSELTWKSDVC